MFIIYNWFNYIMFNIHYLIFDLVYDILGLWFVDSLNCDILFVTSFKSIFIVFPKSWKYFFIWTLGFYLFYCWISLVRTENIYLWFITFILDTEPYPSSEGLGLTSETSFSVIFIWDIGICLTFETSVSI